MSTVKAKLLQTRQHIISEQATLQKRRAAFEASVADVDQQKSQLSKARLDLQRNHEQSVSIEKDNERRMATLRQDMETSRHNYETKIRAMQLSMRKAQDAEDRIRTSLSQWRLGSGWRHHSDPTA